MIAASRSSRAAAVLLVLGAFLLATAPAPVAARPKKAVPEASPSPSPSPTPDAPTVHLATKARRMSTYVFDVRFETTTRDINFEAPPAYKDGFDYWASRMRGQRRSEVYEFQTVTQDVDEHGKIPFRRSIPKFDLELQRQGEIMSATPPLSRSVTSLMYEGDLDTHGNADDVKLIGGKIDAEIEDLGLPEVGALFPLFDPPITLKVGQSFTKEAVVRLPTRVNIAGLENVTVKQTRVYTLRELQYDGTMAIFDVQTIYAEDPAFKPPMDNTSCALSGGGQGEATFDVKRGVFLKSRLPSTMKIDITAPLRPLPDHPETNTSTIGKSHILVDILLVGDQSVRRIWGDEDED